MSIQTELTRITNAKAAIKAAIEGKGVTVPDGTLLDGMAALIDSIEAGGGGGAATGSLVLDTDIIDIPKPFEIIHGLGKIPTAFVMYNEDAANGVSNVSPGALVYYGTTNSFRGIRNTSSSASATLNTFSGARYYIGSSYLAADEQKLTWAIPGSVLTIFAGVIYRWFAA